MRKNFGSWRYSDVAAPAIVSSPRMVRPSPISKLPPSRAPSTTLSSLSVGIPYAIFATHGRERRRLSQPRSNVMRYKCSTEIEADQRHASTSRRCARLASRRLNGGPLTRPKCLEAAGSLFTSATSTNEERGPSCRSSNTLFHRLRAAVCSGCVFVSDLAASYNSSTMPDGTVSASRCQRGSGLSL